MVSERDSIHRLYGGLGVTATFPVKDAVKVKGAVAYKLMNQRGWEAALGVDFKLPNTYNLQTHVLLGGNAHELKYDWGESKGYSVVVEVGVTF